MINLINIIYIDYNFKTLEVFYHFFFFFVFVFLEGNNKIVLLKNKKVQRGGL